MRLLELPEGIRVMIISQEITETHGRSLLQLKDKEQQAEMASWVITEKLTVKELDEAIKRVIEKENPKMEITEAPKEEKTEALNEAGREELAGGLEPVDNEAPWEPLPQSAAKKTAEKNYTRRLVLQEREEGVSAELSIYEERNINPQGDAITPNYKPIKTYKRDFLFEESTMEDVLDSNMEETALFFLAVSMEDWEKQNEPVEPVSESNTGKDESITPIPEGVRLAKDVPNTECCDCKLSTTDHTIGFKFKSETGGYLNVCIKDYRKWEKEQASADKTFTERGYDINGKAISQPDEEPEDEQEDDGAILIDSRMGALIQHSYSASSIGGKPPSKVAGPFKYENHLYVNTSASSKAGHKGWEYECYRLSEIVNFKGNTYEFQDLKRPKDSEKGIYHGVQVYFGDSRMVLVGPPLVFREVEEAVK